MHEELKDSAPLSVENIQSILKYQLLDAIVHVKEYFYLFFWPHYRSELYNLQKYN